MDSYSEIHKYSESAIPQWRIAIIIIKGLKFVLASPNIGGWLNIFNGWLGRSLLRLQGLHVDTLLSNATSEIGLVSYNIVVLP